MRILATLLPPTSGTTVMDGVDVRKAPRRMRELIGYMPDFFGVYDRLKTWEYLDFYARCYGFSYQERMRMIDQLLELVRLSDKRDSYVDVLSRGMKQRLCLAHALIHDPRLLILDEPASGMDPRARAEMKDILRSLKDMGKTVLISSHILPELSEMCDSLTIIDHGNLVFSGTVDALSRKMNGSAPLDIRLLRDQVDAAATILKEFPGVTGIELADAQLLRVDFDGDEQAAAQLLKKLLLGDIAVADFHRAQMNLEKVFMEVTQDD